MPHQLTSDSTTSRLHRLFDDYGQSAWLDNLQRRYLTSGHLQALIDRGVRGLTSNPTIFQKANQDSVDYDDQFTHCISRGLSPTEAYWEMVCDDIAQAATLFLPIFENSSHVDGYVSVEVDPHLSHDTNGTIVAARQLRDRIHRSNVMIKIPATVEGLPAITQMIREGCPVNVTLIFSLQRYREVIEAFIAGLEARKQDGNPIDDVHSVASFFISRVDSEVDAQLSTQQTEIAAKLRGTTAINQAHLAYEIFENEFGSSRWQALAQHGAHVQRPLWASTSTKNPEYVDTMYVDRLVAARSVNTLPEATLEAFADHGHLDQGFIDDYARSHEAFAQLRTCGVNIDEVAQKLERDGVASFVASFDDLLTSLKEKAAS